MSTFSGCADILPDCTSVVANDKDSCKNREMKENCPESCNLCGKSGNAKTKRLSLCHASVTDSAA